MNPAPSLLLSLLGSAGGPRTDPASLLSPDAAFYMRQRHPRVSRFMNDSIPPKSDMRERMEEFHEALEIAAGWELGLLPVEMEKLRGKIVLHTAVFFPEEESGFEQRFELVIEGIPAEKLPARDRAPRQGFYGETAYAIHGDLVLAANDRQRLEKMLLRARGEDRSPSLADDPAFPRARASTNPDEEFYFAPVAAWKKLFVGQIRSSAGIEPARREEMASSLERMVDLLGGALVTLKEDPSRPGEARTDIRFLLDPAHPLFPVYEALRQEGREPRLSDRIPADAGTAGGFRLDAPSLIRRLRELKPPEGGPGDDPAKQILGAVADRGASLPVGPEVEAWLAWLSKTFGGEVACFTKRAALALVTGRGDRRDFGFALSLLSPDGFDSIPESLPKFGIPVEAVEEDLFTAHVPGFPPVFFARDGDAVVGGFAPAAIEQMRHARASGANLSPDPLFRELFPAGRPRSKWFYARVESLQGLLRLFVPALAGTTRRSDRVGFGFETLEESGALHFWLGFSPVSFIEVMSTEASLSGKLVAQSEGLRTSEEKSLASLLALREAEEEFRARGIRDRDGDGLAEYGTLSDLAAASLLPKGLTLAGGTGEAEASGYLFRADLPPQANLAERLWAGYAWPKEYGATGVNAFWIRPKGPPRRRVDASYAGPGKGPRADSAFLPPTPPESPLAEEILWTPVGK